MCCQNAGQPRPARGASSRNAAMRTSEIRFGIVIVRRSEAAAYAMNSGNTNSKGYSNTALLHLF